MQGPTLQGEWGSMFNLEPPCSLPTTSGSSPPVPPPKRISYSSTYEWATEPDCFTVYCSGHHHPSLAEGFPKDDAMQGLMTEPSP